MPSNRIVAIVDDDIDISILFRDALHQISGVSFVSFTSSLIALEHIKINKDNYVLIISDLRMPALNGMELFKKVKDMNPFIRTILITAFEKDEKIFREYSENGIINGFLQKPARLNDLYTEVTNQLHSYGLERNKPVVQLKF